MLLQCSRLIVLLSVMGFAENLAAHPASVINPDNPLPGPRTLRSGASLLLEVPYVNILSGEIPHIYLGIKNESDNPMPLLEPFGSNAEYQLLCEAREASAGPNLTRPEFIPSWERIPKSSVLGFTPFIIATLGRGEHRLFAAQREIVPAYGWVPMRSREIRWSLLTGPNEWVQSDWVRIQRRPDRLEDAETVGTLEGHFSSTYPLRKATIDGESYLFLMSNRIARVPVGATPRFDWERATSLLTVHFDGAAVAPLVYLVRMMETRSWMPETAPHMVVFEKLKQELQNSRSPTSR